MLSDVMIRKAKPGPKPQKLSDGRGLYVLLTPSGQRWWRFKYRFAGKEKLLSLGLRAIDDRRPILVLGAELRGFLRERRAKRKHPTPPGMIYCVGCRQPRPPAGNMVDYIPLSPTSGNFQGICPICDAMIYRRINLGKIEEVRGNLEVTFKEGRRRIADCSNPSLNHDSDTLGPANADA